MKISRAYPLLICLSVATFIALLQGEALSIVDQSRRITSGNTHFRSTLQFGQSADKDHRVDEWGPPVRPYGEWRFPFRPYRVPYSEWDAPSAGLNLGFGFPAVGFPGVGHPGQEMIRRISRSSMPMSWRSFVQHEST